MRSCDRVSAQKNDRYCYKKKLFFGCKYKKPEDHGDGGVCDRSTVLCKTVRDPHAGNIYHCTYLLYCRAVQPCTEPGILRSDKI